MDITALTVSDINNMSYNELIGLTKETNRPPGGYTTVSTICKEAFINSDTKILEIGTSTGFTAVEIARLTHAQVTAIDINPLSLAEAKDRAKMTGVDVTFEVGDATQLQYADGHFDIVFCGNVNSYIAEKEKAFAEYARVLRNNGFLAAVPMYYLSTPSEDLVSRVSDAIKFNITPQYAQDWFTFFEVEPFTLRFRKQYRFDDVSPQRIDEFVDQILKRSHLSVLNADAQGALAKKYANYMQLFGENLAQMGYSILLLRKELYKTDEELFTGSEL